MQMAQFGGAMNINQQVIRYVLQNASVIILFIMPMITMRTYSEEKRSGTIELLLTSPLTDVEIILGKFFGALGLYIAMLAVTLPYMAHPLLLRQPRVAAAGRRLPRAAADGRRVRLARAAHLEHDQQPDRRRHRLVRGVPAAVDRRLVRRLAPGPTIGPITSWLSITEHFDDFSKGIIDTKHVLYYLSLITFGLFLTAKSVDTERWRG